MFNRGKKRVANLDAIRENLDEVVAQLKRLAREVERGSDINASSAKATRRVKR